LGCDDGGVNSPNSDRVGACVVACVSVVVNSGNEGVGGEPSGAQELGGPPSVAQPPPAGEAGGVVTDGVVRACQALEPPEVPHLLAPLPVCIARGEAAGDFSGDAPNSPVHDALRFNHFTPNPSAPSAATPLSPPSPARGAASCCAAVVFCVSCGVECGDGEASYGKCQGCADIAFHSYVAAHCPHLGAHSSNSSPPIGGTATLAVRFDSGQSLPKRSRVAPPPHRKAGPPN
jgi:hypothetical protein